MPQFEGPGYKSHTSPGIVIFSGSFYI